MADNKAIREARGSAGLEQLQARRESALGRKYSKNESDIPSSEEDNADDLLNVLGYQSELNRSRTTWQVAFMSFVLASVPYGLATTLFYPLTGGGPVTIIWGWLGVCLIILCVAISLGEITSVYPTAGGVYYQTFMLAPKHYQRMLAWVCGWSYLLGNIIITLSVNFGTTLFLIGCINIFQDGNGNGIWDAEVYQIYLVFFAITITCNAISSLMNKYLPILDTIAIYWTFGGVIAIICCALAIANEGRHSAEYVFTEFDVRSGWTDGWGFCVGLLHAAYATSATGMIISMCEEVQRPSVQVPKALVGALCLNAICGALFLIPLVFVLPDLASIIDDPYGQPLPFILRSAIGNEGGAFALCVPIIILGILCGTGCTTAASRCVWAFARDGAVPGHKLWRKVNTKLDMPFNAMMLSMVVQLALGLIRFGSAAAFNAFNGSGVIFLTLSYVTPIAVSFFTGRHHLKLGAWNFGILGWFCNAVAIAWCAIAIPLFSMPSTLPVTVEGMNYACVVFVAGVVFSGLYYVVRGRKHYTGPPTVDDPVEQERRRTSLGVDRVGN